MCLRLYHGPVFPPLSMGLPLSCPLHNNTTSLDRHPQLDSCRNTFPDKHRFHTPSLSAGLPFLTLDDSLSLSVTYTQTRRCLLVEWLSADRSVIYDFLCVSCWNIRFKKWINSVVTYSLFRHFSCYTGYACCVTAAYSDRELSRSVKGENTINDVLFILFVLYSEVF